MISRIEGELISVGDGRAELQCGPVAHELFIPAADAEPLAALIGETVAFHTLEYLESQGQGASYVPRLIGFRSAPERAFFELFTTVKGVGTRKALRALRLPFGTIAEAIAAKDVDLLLTLPEIGPRTAETIVAELRGKVDQFVELKPTGAGLAGAGAGEKLSLIQDAVVMLTMLGESKMRARQLIDRALVADATLETPEALVAAVYRLRDQG